MCADGTYDNGSACVTCSSPKTRWDADLNQCTCPTGQIEIGDTCEPKAVCTEPKTDYRELTNTCYCPSDKPFWRDPDCIACPTGATYNDETQTCDCPDEQVFDVEKNKCTLSCGEYQTYDETLEKCVCDTEIIGMIETPNSSGVCVCDEERGFVSTPSNGQCLCDTKNKNFAPTPNENGQCVCANAGDYMALGGAGCYSCVNTTVEWYNRTFAEGVAACDTINTDVCYCKHYKNVKWDSNYNGEYAPAYYNPSTKTYCEPTQVLFKNSSGNYECGSCDRIRTDNTVEVDGVCVCAAGETYNGSKCVSACGKGDYAYYTEEGIACAPCFQQYVYMNSTCHNTPEASLCDSDVNNGLEAGQTGYRYFWWNTWKKNTPATCRAGLNISPTSSGECSWENGCTINKEDLPYCADNAEITSECQCYTGGDIGEICCVPGAYYANGSCVTCPTGQVPNEDKTGCKECEHNQLYINSMCETPCSEDQDAYLIEMTSSTSYRYGCCAAGLSGGYAEDDEGNNGITCCEEGSNYQHITQGGKDVYACCRAGSNLDAIVSNGTVLAKACCATGSDLEALINNDTVIASRCCATDTSIRAIYFYEEGSLNLPLIGANCIPDYFCADGYIYQTQENFGTANVNCLPVN